MSHMRVSTLMRIAAAFGKTVTITFEDARENYCHGKNENI